MVSKRRGRVRGGAGRAGARVPAEGGAGAAGGGAGCDGQGVGDVIIRGGSKM